MPENSTSKAALKNFIGFCTTHLDTVIPKSKIVVLKLVKI
jgi:hypothetical protein